MHVFAAHHAVAVGDGQLDVLYPVVLDELAAWLAGAAIPYVHYPEVAAGFERTG